MVNVVIVLGFLIIILGFIIDKAQKFDNWFKGEVNEFLKKDTERYLRKKLKK